MIVSRPLQISSLVLELLAYVYWVCVCVRERQSYCSLNDVRDKSLERIIQSKALNRKTETKRTESSCSERAQLNMIFQFISRKERKEYTVKHLFYTVKLENKKLIKITNHWMANLWSSLFKINKIFIYKFTYVRLRQRISENKELPNIIMITLLLLFKCCFTMFNICLNIISIMTTWLLANCNSLTAHTRCWARSQTANCWLTKSNKQLIAMAKRTLATVVCALSLIVFELRLANRDGHAVRSAAYILAYAMLAGCISLRPLRFAFRCCCGNDCTPHWTAAQKTATAKDEIDYWQCA